jgi:hypothetical protein
MSRFPLPLLLLLAAALGTIAACDSDRMVACTADLSWKTSPSSKTIHVGESFVVRGELLGCGGAHRLPSDVRWTSADTTLLRVEYLGFKWGDPVSRTRVTGVRAGTGFATGRNATTNRDLPFRVDVTILP